MKMFAVILGLMATIAFIYFCSTEDKTVYFGDSHAHGWVGDDDWVAGYLGHTGKHLQRCIRAVRDADHVILFVGTNDAAKDPRTSNIQNLLKLLEDKRVTWVYPFTFDGDFLKEVDTTGIRVVYFKPQRGEMRDLVHLNHHGYARLRKMLE